MTLGTILLVLLVLMLIGSLPSWPYSRSWGYRGTSLIGVVLAVVLILALFGMLPLFPGPVATH